MTDDDSLLKFPVVDILHHGVFDFRQPRFPNRRHTAKARKSKDMAFIAFCQFPGDAFPDVSGTSKTGKEQDRIALTQHLHFKSRLCVAQGEEQYQYEDEE